MAVFMGHPLVAYVARSDGLGEISAWVYNYYITSLFNTHKQKHRLCLAGNIVFIRIYFVALLVNDKRL